MSIRSLLLVVPAVAAPIEARQGLLADVFDHQKVDVFEGAFGGELETADEFGHSLAAIGDLDGDGLSEIAVGMPGSDPGNFSNGLLWILFPNGDGTVASELALRNGQNGFAGPTSFNGCFGRSVAALGDFDGAGAADIVVGEPQDCTLFAHDEGVIWLLFLDTDGTVLGQKKIGAATSGFGGSLDANDAFGHSVTALGDLDGNGVVDLAVGAPGDDDGGLNRGAVWILFLAPDGSVLSEVKIASGSGGFAGALADTDEFGSALANLGDWDFDGAPEIAVGAHKADDLGVSRGAVWILSLAPAGTVKSHVEISEGVGGFVGPLQNQGRFGTSIAPLGDIDGTGWMDIAVGAEGMSHTGADDITSPGRGVVWLLFLEPGGSVIGQRKVSAGTGGFVGNLGPSDRFGSALATLPNLDGGVAPDLAVGAWGDSLENPDQGAYWTLFLDSLPSGASTAFGCALNPPGSLVDLGDVPAPGNTVILGIDNPLGTQDPGAFPFLWVSLAPIGGLDPFVQPCGLLLPGLGMDGPGAAGELLVDITLLAAPTFVGPIWSGPGIPSPVPLPIPSKPALIGLSVYAQGLLFDAPALSGVQIGLTTATELFIGV